MKLISELRFLAVSTLVFMLISMFAVLYLFFYADTPHHFGNTTTDSLLVADVSSSVTIKEDKGRTLFKSNCRRCHYTTDQKFVGPGLKGVMGRITEDQFLSWVKDPAKTRKKDKYFQDLYEEYNESTMPSFSYLKEDELVAIMNYVNNSSGEPEVLP